MSAELVNDLVAITDKKSLSIEDKASLRVKISELEDFMLKQPQIEEQLKHTFSPGVYARQLFIPKGAIVVGKIHKHENMNIIIQGKVTFFSTDGAVQVEAPHTFVASPGVKRVIFAHEDTLWTTIHGTSETDLGKIEDEFIAKDYSEIESISEQELKLIKGE